MKIGSSTTSNDVSEMIGNHKNNIYLSYKVVNPYIILFVVVLNNKKTKWTFQSNLSYLQLSDSQLDGFSQPVIPKHNGYDLSMSSSMDHFYFGSHHHHSFNQSKSNGYKYASHYSALQLSHTTYTTSSIISIILKNNNLERLTFQMGKIPPKILPSSKSLGLTCRLTGMNSSSEWQWSFFFRNGF